MTKYKHFIPVVLFPAIILAGESDLPAVTGERGVLPQAVVTGEALPAPAPAVTGETLPEPSAETTEEEKVDLAAARDADLRDAIARLSESVRSADKDTGAMPEAGFSVTETFAAPELEKLLLALDRSYFELEFLLTDLKNGFLRERIVKALSGRGDDKSKTLLTFALKDRSSGVRLNAASALGRDGTEKDIKSITSLLYDKYMQRRDVYPVRTAAKEAIELIKFRESLKELPENEKAAKLLLLLKEKGLKKDNYFLEYIASELGRIASAKDAVWVEAESIKAIVGGLPVSTAGSTITTAAIAITTEMDKNKVLAWLYLVSARLKDERVLPDLEKGLKEPELYYICMRGMAALNREAVVSMLFNEAEGSKKASLLLKILKTELSAEQKGDFLPSEGIPDDALNEKLERLMMLDRNKERYLDAGFVFAQALNDYEKAKYYIDLFDLADDKKNYIPARDRLLSECLLNQGKFAQSREVNPLLDDRAQKMYFPLIVSLINNVKEGKGNVDGELSLLARFLMETGRYRNAMDSIKTLYLLGDHSSQQKEKAEKLIKKCEKEIDSVINKYLNQIFVLKEDKLKLELTPEKQTYKAGEEIKLALKVANVLKTPIYFLNDTEGTRGPDAGIFKNGILIRRIKAGLVKNLPPSELVGKLITIKPGESFETSITILPGNRNTEGEYDILASYDGGEAFLGFEKGWIRNILLSERIKIKTDR